MNEQEQMNFCPKCGAVLKDGVCQICGYEAPRQSEQIDNVIYSAPIYSTPDVYQTQVDQDIYQMQSTEVVPQDTGGRFSGLQPEYGNTQNSNNGNIYNPYGSGQYQNNGNVYGQGQYSGTGNAYGQGQYPGTGNAYGQSQYPGTGNTYGQGQYSNTSNVYGQGQYSNAGNVYGQGQYSNIGNDYGKNQYQNNQNPYGAPYSPYYGYDNPYSPYAVPQKKKHTGLIIGVIITAVILFLIALFALLYNAFDSMTKDNDKDNNWSYFDDYYNDYDDYYDYDDYFYNYDDDYFYDYDDGYGYGYGDNYGFDFNHDHDYDDHDYDSDEYYTLHNDIKEGLSYTVDMEEYNYDTDNADVLIYVKYPVIKGENVPNLDKINETIADEYITIKDFFEGDYSKYMLDEYNYFIANSEGYVTYMSEDVLSIVFSEYIYSDYMNLVNLYCINIDMKDGVIMDNTALIDVNDDFSVDFRKRSDTQNGPISSLTMMTDQEITKYLTTDDNLIIFYTPQGMEIGFNYSEGWVTVTYKDYEDFLKIF